MNKTRKPSRSLFLRLWLRALTVKRPQAALGVAAVLMGAALATALLNLHDGVRRKMTQEFRAYGANAMVSARGDASGGASSSLLGQDVLSGLAAWRESTPGAVLAPMLHVVMRLRPAQIDQRLPEFQNVVVVGTDFEALRTLYPNWRIADEWARHGVPLQNAGQDGSGTQESDVGARRAAPLRNAEPPGAGNQESGVGARHGVPVPQGDCVVGTRVASTLRLATSSEISVEPAETAQGTATALKCRISGILSTGGAEDDQLFVPLAGLQRAAALDGNESVIELLIPGEAAEVERTVAELGTRFPQAGVRPVRAIVESQGKVLGTIRWLLVALTALILVIVALCVMATMTALVLERKKDIAIMKALGATDRLIMRLFLCEGAGMGLTGGLLGFGVGLLLARELGLKLFGVPLDPAWWTLPLVGLGSVAIAVLATAFPVRMAQAVQPATTLKGV
jgi:putative ABC transport system permease protein